MTASTLAEKLLFSITLCDTFYCCYNKTVNITQRTTKHMLQLFCLYLANASLKLDTGRRLNPVDYFGQILISLLLSRRRHFSKVNQARTIALIYP